MSLFIAVVNFFFANGQINTEQMLNVGRNALYFEDYVLSIQYFNRVIEAKPYLARPYFFRALAKYNLDDMRGALADVSMAIERNPFITECYELRGVVRQNLDQPREALSDFSEALNQLPDNKDLLLRKASVLSELGDSTALEAFNKLINAHPRFENARTGRARLLLAKGDTIGAVSDIEEALRLSSGSSLPAHALASEVEMQRCNWEKAITHIDAAIKLSPREAGLYINRAFLRYRLDDYPGAMADYDLALQLDPANFVALYNRALLCAEVKDYDKALTDLNMVLKMRPAEYRALYNRALIYRDRQQWNKAVADINAVINAFPNLAAAYFLRYDIKRQKGDRSAQRDLDRSLALARERIKVKGKENASDISDIFGTPTVDDHVTSDSEENDGTESQDVVAARFSALLTMRDQSDKVAPLPAGYNPLRGRLQDRAAGNISPQPLITLTYTTEANHNSIASANGYINEIEPVNNTRALPMLLQAAPQRESVLRDSIAIADRFTSIAYYNSYLATHTPRAIDLFGRGMDRMAVYDFSGALSDFKESAVLSPKFVLAPFMEAIAMHRLLHSHSDDAPDATFRRKQLQNIIAKIDTVIALSPMMAAAYYNKGTLLIESGDLAQAEKFLSQAIDLKPDFDLAYYNRAFVRLKLGDSLGGRADLSKAGELGVAPSYRLMKRLGMH